MKRMLTSQSVPFITLFQISRAQGTLFLLLQLKGFAANRALGEIFQTVGMKCVIAGQNVSTFKVGRAKGALHGSERTRETSGVYIGIAAQTNQLVVTSVSQG